MAFVERIRALPYLGLGVSTEYGAGGAPGALDVEALRARAPGWAAFLEVGVEATRGLDADARRWAAAGRPTTYHFLDVNLDDPADLDAAWLDDVRGHCEVLRPAWLCGDAGLWHFGRRERGHMLLLPPVLTDDAADRLADGICALREATGFEVLPENPPGQMFIGDRGLLEFFARVCERADTGMLLDAAHLAIYQRVMGRAPTEGLDDFPLERVVEIHVAGASVLDVEGLEVIEDDHNTAVLPDTWAILDAVAPRAPNLRAVVFECERNPLDAVLSGFAALEARLAETPFGRGRREMSR